MAGTRYRGTTTERGYGAAHQKARAELQPVIDEGHAYCCALVCLERSRWIAPGSDWHLGHTPDRSGYIGPCHPRCNESEGGVRGNPRKPGSHRLQHADRSSWSPTQDW